MRIANTPALFRPSMIRTAGGGYSTYKGPWWNLGLELSDLNSGLEWAERGELYAYCYDIYFFTRDIPGMDEIEIMMKLQDNKWTRATYEWYQDGLAEADHKMLDSLAHLQNHKKMRDVLNKLPSR